ncbi:MAG: EAL domain-containing protein [Sulfurimonas sp.]|nr:EAL domain-containing protein [Sulfurimonas sp.]
MYPNELESFVIDAINKHSVSILSQDVYLGGEVAFKECYIKLRNSDGKLLYPKSYIKIINKLGLLVEYDMMLIKELLLQIPQDTSNIYALNVSPASLRNEKFLSLTKELLSNSNKKIMFILSEQEYYSYTKKYNSIIKSLKEIGVLIAIDKLGSYHSSFLYLKELDIDVIRFDTQYSSYEKMKKYSAIISGFNHIAVDKGLSSWIKNIETPEAYELAKSLDIKYIQGKYLSDLKAID